MIELAIVGGGPAGLRAAEVAASAGVKVTLFDAKASVGRKFLVAGKGGLNITNAEPQERFVRRYSHGPWRSLIADFDADALRAWAAEFGVETFAASTGRVYPREMKAAPLLRRWVQRLRELGVGFAMNLRWTGLREGDPLELIFTSPDGERIVQANAVLLALGGASWPDTGSDGRWQATLAELGINIAPLAPANCGWETAWPDEVVREAEGEPLKNVAVRAGDLQVAGELMVTRYGLEGGALYQLGSTLREAPDPVIEIDFKPDQSADRLAEKLAPSARVALLEAARVWKLSAAATAILRHAAGCPLLANPKELARWVKACPIRLIRPRPIAEAISSAGGIRWDELDESLMLRKLPGVFVAGEMIDWEAPTGGYLIQGCFATGTRAARGAVEWLKSRP